MFTLHCASAGGHHSRLLNRAMSAGLGDASPHMQTGYAALCSDDGNAQGGGIRLCLPLSPSFAFEASGAPCEARRRLARQRQPLKREDGSSCEARRGGIVGAFAWMSALRERERADARGAGTHSAGAQPSQKWNTDCKVLKFNAFLA
ncbi:hypothetical protein AAFF_G00097830 [Aldrovandia affinis]|uniref:Uncharacterized protein n=1 Tax=Aldrovandia affinis TaxID=143900 RepID=A0AAD7WBZ7_9TELE|nr:hypothetical protein AAFF_G00097830 [Aldrovandia affinis]